MLATRPNAYQPSRLALSKEVPFATGQDAKSVQRSLSSLRAAVSTRATSLVSTWLPWRDAAQRFLPFFIELLHDGIFRPAFALPKRMTLGTFDGSDLVGCPA
jgi:hypothetical protein